MRIAPASDLHMEVSTFKPTSAMKNADVIVLAGDIAQGMAGLEWAAKQDKPVVYVNGNHEYDYNDVITLEQEMRDFCKVHPNVHFLQEDQWVYGNVRFLGCTLWTDFELYGIDFKSKMLPFVQRAMPEYQTALMAGEKLRVSDIQKINMHQVQWLRMMLHEPFQGHTVVVTHHAPHPKSLNPLYKNEALNVAFASNFERLLGLSAAWIHGHTHYAVDYTMDDTRILSNPRGYFKVANQVPSREFQEMILHLE